MWCEGEECDRSGGEGCGVKGRRVRDKGCKSERGEVGLRGVRGVV